VEETTTSGSESGSGSTGNGGSDGTSGSESNSTNGGSSGGSDSGGEGSGGSDSEDSGSEGSESEGSDGEGSDSGSSGEGSSGDEGTGEDTSGSEPEESSVEYTPGPDGEFVAPRDPALYAKLRDKLRGEMLKSPNTPNGTPNTTPTPDAAGPGSVLPEWMLPKTLGGRITKGSVANPDPDAPTGTKPIDPSKTVIGPDPGTINPGPEGTGNGAPPPPSGPAIQNDAVSGADDGSSRVEPTANRSSSTQNGTQKSSAGSNSRSKSTSKGKDKSKSKDKKSATTSDLRKAAGLLLKSKPKGRQ
jgi:hypothetical protein